MDLAPLLYIIRTMERPLLLLIRGLLLVVSTIFMVSAILAISQVSRVDFSVVLLLLHGPLTLRLKKLASFFKSLDACVCDCE
jgi:hypothetical protein